MDNYRVTAITACDEGRDALQSLLVALVVMVLFQCAYRVVFQEWFVPHKRRTPSSRDQTDGAAGGMP